MFLCQKLTEKHVFLHSKKSFWNHVHLRRQLSICFCMKGMPAFVFCTNSILLHVIKNYRHDTAGNVSCNLITDVILQEMSHAN